MPHTIMSFLGGIEQVEKLRENQQINTKVESH